MTTSLRRSGARTRSLATLLTGVALAASLAACGSDDGGDTATDPAASTSTSPEPSTDPGDTSTSSSPETDTGSASSEPIDVVGSAEVTTATLVTGTDGGGNASDLAFAVDTDQARADFISQLDGGFADVVGKAAAEQQAAVTGSTTYAAVVGVGCERPRSVAIDAGEAGFQVVAKLPKSTIECLAAMTFVVLFSVPDA